MDKDDYEILKDYRENLLEDFVEDPISFLEDCGGIDGLIKDYWWEEES